ncbi:MAG: protein kinase [Deltaproteobacteria bacterium]
MAGSLRQEDLAAIDEHLVVCDDCTWVVSSAAVDLRSQACEPIGTCLVPGERFEQLDFIAQGAMGVVYRGRDRQTGGIVVIKRLQQSAAGRDVDAVARFVRESEILRRLDHPNIVKIIASIHDGEEHEIVMEYVAGGSLRDVLKTERRLEPRRVVSLMLELTDALARAHHLNVVHRDIKPENILLAADGTPRLSDFGLAKLGDQALSAAGAVLGTVPYLSPEALSGKVLDERADLWSLGVVLFEVLAGFRPFGGEDPATLVAAILHETVPDLSKACPAAPAALIELTNRMLARDRDERIDSARHAAAALEDIVRGKSQMRTQGGSGSSSRTLRQPAARSGSQAASPHFVGRQEALMTLHDSLRLAIGGQRQTVFVTGEAGIGKTTLVNAFLREQQEEGTCMLAWGQCIRQYGAGEAYLPVLEALSRMCRQHENSLLDTLRTHAPSWIAQLSPWGGLSDLRSPVCPVPTVATPQRMLREMAELAEHLAQERPFVLLFEDLHWADYSTLDLVSYLARRSDPARLLVVGTFRAKEASFTNHPLAAIQLDLQAHDRCHELELDYLDELAVEEYLLTRFPRGQWPVAMVQLLQKRTGGNPLFLVRVVDDWAKRGWLKATTRGWELTVDLRELSRSVPQSVEAMLSKESERLSAFEEAVLNAASASGFEFSTESVASAIDGARSAVEEVCTEWARRGRFVRHKGQSVWPDGTTGLRFEFIHQLYQQVAYDRVQRSVQLELHRRIGERKERGYVDRTHVIAVELAAHFDQARDSRRAIQYRHVAGNQALQRSACREAVDHFSRAIELVTGLEQTLERHRLELELQVALGASLAMYKGFSAPEVEQVYSRALELCTCMADNPELLPIRAAIRNFHLTRGNYAKARELGEHFLSGAVALGDARSRLEGDLTLALSCMFEGELDESQRHIDATIAQCSLCAAAPPGLFVVDPGLMARRFGTLLQWMRGFPDLALIGARQAVSIAREMKDSFALAGMLSSLTRVHYLRGEDYQARERAEALLAFCNEQGFAFWRGTTAVELGRLLAAEGYCERGYELAEKGWSIYRATGAQMGGTYLGTLVAETYGRAGRIDAALDILTEAFAALRDRHERYWESELYRVSGVLLTSPRTSAQNRSFERAAGMPASAESCFLKSLETAKQMGARSMELRAALSLAQLWQHSEKSDQAWSLLRDAYDSFTEGLDTPALREARQFLDGPSAARGAPTGAFGSVQT